MLADYHMHTSFSDDSVYPMEEEIKHAIAIALMRYVLLSILTML